MSYSSNISGIDLFELPFSHHSARQQASSYPKTANHHPETEQFRPSQLQTRHQNAVQQPVFRETAAQDVKPETEAARKIDIMPKKVAENECTKPESETKASDQAQAEKTQADVPETQPAPAKQKEQTETQQKELVLDMSSGSGSISNNKSDDTARRKAHEAAEAKRKAEWDARQLEKKQKEEAAIQKLHNMSDSDIIAASTKRISTDVERITRRNMKECVAEHVQGLCRKDPAFARLTMHPHKSMAHCFLYINRKAKEFILQEMEENGIPKDSNGYGSDVPDGLCYQWSEDYFHDADAPEDTEKEENFVPKPYTGTVPKNKNSASPKKSSKKKEEKLSEPGEYEQMSFV